MPTFRKADPGDPDPARAEAHIAQAAIEEATGTGTHEQVRVDSADLYLYRQEYYERARRARRTDRQLAFILGFVILAFGLLAFRTERNSVNLNEGFYDACRARAAAAVQYNEGIANLIAVSNQQPQNPPLTPEQQAIRDQQIRDAFLRPVEECGSPP